MKGTGNRPLPPSAVSMSRKVMEAGMNAKVIAQRLVDHPAATEELLEMGNDLIQLAKQIDEKEIYGGASGTN